MTEDDLSIRDVRAMRPRLIAAMRRRLKSHLRVVRGGRRFMQDADPSGTAPIVRRYQSEIADRFNELLRLIEVTVVENDALRLGDPPALERAARLRLNQPARRFQFPQDRAGKIEAFTDWFSREFDQLLLTPDDWANTYIRGGYLRGIEHAQTALAAAGETNVSREALETVFRRPVHVENVAALYLRNFQGLRGIGAATDARISTVLANGLVNGLNPNQMATQMVAATRAVGLNRARTLARTEIIRAHADATLATYGDAGVREVVGQAEFSTAGDDRVCPQCEGLDGFRFSLEEARGLIPVHPNCLPGDALVLPRGRILAATKRWSEVDLVVLQCAGGLPLSTTPNHPVLTRRGWLPASEVEVGDEVAHPGLGERVAAGDGQDVDIPARAEELAEAFFGASGVTTVPVPVTAEHFHGDGVDGEVCVVGTDGFLLDDAGDAVVSEHRADALFDVADPDLAALPGLCREHQLLAAASAPPGGLVSGGDLSGSLGVTHARPLHGLGLGLAPGLDPSGAEASVDDVPADAVPPGEGVHALAADVQARDLVYRKVESVGHRPHVGWVYNFETESGYYLADGYATHNCRCVWLPTINEDAPRGRTPTVPTTGPRLVPEERFDPVEATPDEFVAALRERAEQGAARKAAISDEFDELNAEYAQLYQRYEEGAFTEEAMAAKRAALQEKRIEVRARYDAVLEEAQPDVRDLLVHRGAARKEVTTTRTRTIQSAIGDEIDKAEEWLNDVVPARWKAAIDDVKIGTDRGGRSYHENGQIKMGKRKSAKTVVHEMGHAFGYYDRYRAPTSQNLLVQERAWRDARQAASGKGVQRLRDLTGIRYGLDEVADPDEFFSPYVGKIYEWGSTEVLSMGLEEMYRNPIEFFEKDPEHFAFILRFLQGKDPYPEGAP